MAVREFSRGRRAKSLLARLGRSSAAQRGMGNLLAAGVQLVHLTSSVTSEPTDSEHIFDAFAPMIITTWHALGFMLPMARSAGREVDVLVSRDREAEKIARMLERLGCGVIRGSGVADPARVFESGGANGFRRMRASLDEGRSVVVTADFLGGPPRTVSPGVIALARASGRPIVPVVSVSSRRFTRSTWDSTQVSLPFGHLARVFGTPVTVPAEADEGLLRAKRTEVETSLNIAASRAFFLVDGLEDDDPSLEAER